MILIISEQQKNLDSSSFCEQRSHEQFKSWIRKGTFLRHLFKYDEVRYEIYEPKTLRFFVALLLFLLSKGKVIINAPSQDIQLGFKELLHKFHQFVKDFTGIGKVFGNISKDIKKIEHNYKFSKELDLRKTPLYLRTDLWFGLKSGGSIGHTAGVLNHLDQAGAAPFFISSDNIPTVRADIETQRILPDENFWNFPEIPPFHFNEIFYKKALHFLKKKEISFIYQRYSRSNFAGLKLSQDLRVPFILEYNGSEVWINKNWGKPLKYENMTQAIETLNLKQADLVVVVSKPIKDELLEIGVDQRNILVNPNGVDENKYSPHIDGKGIKSQYNLEGKITLGFIGTFGRWHGADFLAEVFKEFLEEHKSLRPKVRLLLIGDGLLMPKVREVLKDTPQAILTGLIPQEEGPEYLAACDILISPHMPNPDGSPFFGSPTKLFEYMAMAKPIIAADLDQIGEILEDNKTALLYEPGNKEAFKNCLLNAIHNIEKISHLGTNARQCVLENYTWEIHTKRIIDKLRELYPA